MDKELENNMHEVIDQLKKWSIEDVELAAMDPISKMMLAALLYETQKIRDSIKRLPERILERFCENFIPRRNISAMPAITILEPNFKKERMEDCVAITEMASFLYKAKDTSIKPLIYIPIFQNLVIPIKGIYWMTSECFHSSPEISKNITSPVEQKNILWIGLNTTVELECLKGLSFLFMNTKGVSPVRIMVGDSDHELSFATMNHMERVSMLEPFDSQQSSEYMFSILQEWKEVLLNNHNVSLVYLTDPTKDRDLFKPKHHPSIFQFCLLSEDLESIREETVWLKVVFPEGYQVPDDCSVIVNAFPVVNVSVDQVLLTASNPIAKMQKQDDEYFLGVLRTSNQSRKEGFDMEEDEYLIRDFDVACYHDGDLYRDVRNLYHHFIEDYYAFIEYNGIKDGEMIRQLRESFNKIEKSVGTLNSKYKFDSGVYAMRNINRNPQPASTKVAFATTKGNQGNLPQAEETMESRKKTAFIKDYRVVVSASGGRDKSTADERYEQLRYYTLTNDRLYTKMDIDAFLRKEIMAEFGPEEFKRIFIQINIEGAGGNSCLQRGLYIDIAFKDKKNYEKAVKESFAPHVQQQIINKSCLVMPVRVKLVNLEE